MTYEMLDKAIIDAIANGKTPEYSYRVHKEAELIARGTNRYTSRVIDGRLQALRKAGKIKYIRSVDSKGRVGWIIV